MTWQAMSLMDVLAPPGNRWLMELSRRKAALPPGVQIVRFNDAEDDLDEDGADAGAKVRRRKTASDCGAVAELDCGAVAELD